jgi:hypothetical protein
MVAILMVGLVCGLLAYWRDQERRRELMAAEVRLQDAVTTSVLKDFEREAQASATRGSKGAGSSDIRWNVQVQMLSGYQPATHELIDLEIRGGSEHFRLKPIVIEDRVAEFNPRIVERLGSEYRARGWAYSVVSRPATDPQ